MHWLHWQGRLSLRCRQILTILVTALHRAPITLTKKIIASGPPAELRDHSEDEWVRRFFRREAEGTQPEVSA